LFDDHESALQIGDLKSDVMRFVNKLLTVSSTVSLVRLQRRKGILVEGLPSEPG